MLDLKILAQVLKQLEEERGISKDALVDAIENTLAAAYKKDFGKTGQIIRTDLNLESGKAEFFQVKKVLDVADILEEGEEVDIDSENPKVRFNEERHIMLEDAKKIQGNISAGEEIVFPLETKSDFGRIAAQTAKQVVIQKLREAERNVVMGEFAEKEGTIVTGEMQRFERGSIFINLGQTIAIMPFEQQIRGERFKQGERIRTYVLKVDDQAKKGSFITVSRSDPRFVVKLFERESPELADGLIETRKVERIPGVRTKIAVSTKDDSIDPVGALVGQRGLLVSTIINELHGEKIDVIEWSDTPEIFLEESFSPANVTVKKIENGKAIVNAEEDQIFAAVGIEGQNIKLVSKFTGHDIDLFGDDGKKYASTENGEVTFVGNLPDKRTTRKPRREEGGV